MTTHTLATTTDQMTEAEGVSKSVVSSREVWETLVVEDGGQGMEQACLHMVSDILYSKRVIPYTVQETA